MDKNLLITFKFSQHYTIFPQFQVKQIYFGTSNSIGI